MTLHELSQTACDLIPIAALLCTLCAWLQKGYLWLVKHKGTKRSTRSAAGIESAREHARAARVAQGLPAQAEDVQPPTVERQWVQLASGEWWPADEPVPPEVAALEPQVSVWDPKQSAARRGKRTS